MQNAGNARGYVAQGVRDYPASTLIGVAAVSVGIGYLLRGRSEGTSENSLPRGAQHGRMYRPEVPRAPQLEAAGFVGDEAPGWSCAGGALNCPSCLRTFLSLRSTGHIS